MKLKIIYDKFLRRTVQPVTVFDQTLKKEAEQMLTVMHQHAGLGLAANQVGIDKQLIVFGYEPTGPDDELPHIPVMALCNPQITKLSQEKETLNEGCLSLPGLELPVSRSLGVTVTAQNVQGKAVTVKAKGLLARILQHEIDHLNGVLFTDRATEVNNLEPYRFARIVFLGSDDFSQVIFNSLIENDLNVLAVIAETAKPSGRGRELTEPAMKAAADQAGVAIFQPADKTELTSIIRQLRPDLLILASYGKILPAETLAVPVYGSLNVHPSLLPKYRGATPLQSAILDGVAETGVTIMTMIEGVDAGGLVAQETVVISPTDTTPTLKEKLANQGAQLLLKNLPRYLAGQAEIKEQTAEEATKTVKLTKEMGEINWSQPVEAIDRQIRALTPWPGTYTFLGEQRLKILSAHLANGRLLLETVQLEGRQSTNWPDFQRGYQQQLTKTDWFGKIS